MKKIFKDLFFLRTLALASSIPVFGLESVCPWPRIFFVSLVLASSLVSLTPPVLTISTFRDI